MMKNTYQYAFIGAGNMAKGLINGMIASGISAQSIIASTRTKASAARLTETFSVFCVQDNNACLSADIVVLAVKPQMLAEVLATINIEELSKKLIISVIAGLPCQAYFQHIASGISLVRTMPNMPAVIGEGMTGLYAENCSEADKRIADKLLRCVGKTLWVQTEAEIDYINAISGSGPAYVYGFIQHLAEAGEKLGLSYQDALFLSVQTVLGSAKLAQQNNDGTAESVQALISQITSKGGTTFSAMQSFDKDGLAATINNAVESCYRRALELGKNNVNLTS
ncbi:MAG: pyrroline-5-carboxylate reductase [Ostreibacterium sp.]